MDKTDAPTNRATPTKDATVSAGRSTFVSAALDMSWKLAVVVLVPLLVGVQLDKKLDSAPVYTLVGLVLAFAGSVVVMWRAMQAANRLPVPKLSLAQKRAIQKRYEEDDD